MKHLIEATPFEGEQDPKTLPNPQRMPPLPHNWVEPWDPSMQAEFRSGWKSFDFLIFGASIASLLTISSTFNSLFKVLCIFPSRYLCAIGLSPVFSFGWNLPPRIFGLHSQTTRLLESTTSLSAPRQEIAGKKGCPPSPTQSTGLSPSMIPHSKGVGPYGGRSLRCCLPRLQFEGVMSHLPSKGGFKDPPILNLSFSRFTRRY